jgi:predicted Fe-Mo cluster-binding NifX family protein
MCRDILSDTINRQFSKCQTKLLIDVRNGMKKSVQRDFGLEPRFEE